MYKYVGVSRYTEGVYALVGGSALCTGVMEQGSGGIEEKTF